MAWWRGWRRGARPLAGVVVLLLATGALSLWQLARSDHVPSFRRGGVFRGAHEVAMPGVTSTLTPDTTTPPPTRPGASPSPVARPGRTPAGSTDAPVVGSASSADPVPVPAPPGHGTYTYAVDGWEEATGFGRRDYPEAMTLVAHGDGQIADDEVVFDLEFSAQHEEREIVAYRADGVSLTFEGGSVTFGPTTQTSEADYRPPMTQVPLPSEIGGRRTGRTEAVEGDGDVVRVEEWTAEVTGRETIDVAGAPADTWVVRVDRTTTPESSETVDRHRVYWYEPARRIWVRWTEDLHAERDLGPFTFTYDTEYTATLRELAAG